MHEMPDALILIPQIYVENANAISSPITWGFPGPTAFTGFLHALNLKLNHDDISLDGIGVVSHGFEPMVYKPDGFINQFNLMRFPMGKDGKPVGTVEEGRAHLTISLLIGVYGDVDEDDGQELADTLKDMMGAMRLAGGSIRVKHTKKHHARYIELSDDSESNQSIFKKHRRALMPGFAFMHKPDILDEHLAEIQAFKPNASRLDALLSLSAIHYEPGAEVSAGKCEWSATRAVPGWVVPIPLGYGAISKVYEPGVVANTRDQDTPFCFVESVYSVAQWVSPHRVNNPVEVLWYHAADEKNQLYLCRQGLTTLGE